MLQFKMYEHEHNKKMSTTAVAAMLSTMLYSRRFFPFYVYNIVAGLDEEGNFNYFSTNITDILIFVILKKSII